MATTNFVNGTTPIVAPWLNDVDASTYNVINVKHEDYGAKGDGVTDDTAAFVAAWAAAVALDYPVLYIPAGDYILSSQTARFIPADGMVICGAGMHATRLYWKETGSSPDTLIGNTSSDASINTCEIRDLHIRGTHGDGADYTQAAYYPILIYNVDEKLTIRNVQVSYCRSIGMNARACKNVEVTGCYVHHTARDGINLSSCLSTTVTDNTVEYCDDDSIAIHTHNTADYHHRHHVVSGNKIRFAQGIKLLAAKSALITSNTLEFCFAQGIAIQSQDGGGASTWEGYNAANGITISGNTIKNMIDRTAIDGLNTSAPYIRIGGDAQQAGGLAGIPGESDGSTGIISLYEYFENTQGNIDTTPVPGNYNITITGNTLARDIDAVTGNISDLGYGSFWTRNGSVDPAITLANMLENGINVQPGITRNVIIDSNTFMGLSTALGIGATVQLFGRFTNNVIYDCSSSGIEFDSGSTGPQGLYIGFNDFDIDPLHIHSNRGANGTWTANGAPAGIQLNNAEGLIAEGNRFRNCCRPSDKMDPAGTNLIDWRRNIVEAEPTAINFNAANKGVGNCPQSGQRFLYRIVDSDPAAATYGDVLNNCFEDANAVPSTGTYVKGHFCRNTAPSLDGNNMVIIGWIRLTTGTGHVSGTDWAICNASHVSPAT